MATSAGENSILILFNKTVNRRHIVGHRRSYNKMRSCMSTTAALQLAADRKRRAVPIVTDEATNLVACDHTEYLTDVFRSLSPSHTGLTTRLRPPCDRFFFESWANRRKNVQLVAEVVGRSKVVVMFKTAIPQSHRAYDKVNTYLRPKCWNRGEIVERT